MENESQQGPSRCGAVLYVTAWYYAHTLIIGDIGKQRIHIATHEMGCNNNNNQQQDKNNKTLQTILLPPAKTPYSPHPRKNLSRCVKNNI